MLLYQIQDDDRPMFVMADSFSHALAKWRAKIQEENPDHNEAVDGAFDPQGVMFVSDEVLL